MSDEIARMISECIDEGRDLNDWERNFLESISTAYETYGTLTERQAAVLEKIHNEKVEY